MNKSYRLAALTLLTAVSTWAMAEDKPALVEGTPVTVSASAIQAATSMPVVEAVQKRDNTVLISPRTGMRYTVNNAGNRPIQFKTDALQPISAQNVNRIVATNPALSAQSQQTAEKALLDLANIAPTSNAPQISAPALPTNNAVAAVPNVGQAPTPTVPANAIPASAEPAALSLPAVMPPAQPIK